MPRFANSKPEGVIPATLLVLHPDLSIDEKITRKQLQDCAQVPGVDAVTMNGHASETHARSFDEQERILAAMAAGRDHKRRGSRHGGLRRGQTLDQCGVCFSKPASIALICNARYLE